MARLYHVDIARHAANADGKWIDNLLSHHQIPGVDSGRQGSARRISVSGIEYIALVRLLTSELRLSVSVAAALAARLIAIDSEPLPLGSGLQLRLDLAEFRRRVHQSIDDGVESVTPARRGRPVKSSRATS